MTKRKIHPKWYLCASLFLLGCIAMFVLQGYTMTALIFFGFAALIPMYHLLGVLKNHKPWLGKVLIRLLSLFLCVLFIAMAVTCGIIVRSAAGTDEPTSEYLVVLGAGVNGTVPSRSLRERLDAAYDYLTNHPDSVAIVSGCQGGGEDITEARCMYNYLTAAGITPDRVWMEEKATNTLENLRYSLDIAEEKAGTRPSQIAIVSSEYHLHRAGMFADWLNIEAELIPAETSIFPLRWNYYIREIFAVWYYSLLGGTN